MVRNFTKAEAGGLSEGPVGKPGSMIISVNLNPAIDRRLQVKRIAVGEMNRAASVQLFPGDKAAPVASNSREVKTEGGTR